MPQVLPFRVFNDRCSSLFGLAFSGNGLILCANGGVGGEGEGGALWKDFSYYSKFQTKKR